VPEGVEWSGYQYVAKRDSRLNMELIEKCFIWDARLDTFTRCQETMAIPEITKEQVFFALCCHMEDPSDDEEDGFNAGVSWCMAFIKQEIAKRNKK
jgi:hypothetical protein